MDKLIHMQGIETHGIGNWRPMIDADPALGSCDESTLRLKAMRCLGSQSLTRYQGWKGGLE